MINESTYSTRKMRLIDGDALMRTHESEVATIGRDWTVGDLAAAIETAPTIDAIPVRQLEYYNDTFDGVLTIGNVLKAWKDKQFPFFSDHSKGECNEEI